MRKNVLLSIIITLVVILIYLFSNQETAAAIRTKREVWATTGDTSTELQDLLNYNQYDQYHLTVRIPAGTYDLEKELRIYSNTTIIADQNAKFIKNHQRGAMLANDLSKDKGGYGTTENIKIIGGIWDSSKVSHGEKGTESLRFIHATNVTVKDATIRNVPESSHLVTFAGVKNGVVDNCVLYGYIGDDEKEAIHIDIVHDNVMVPSMQEKNLVYDDLSCDGITIMNTEIYNYPRAIGSHTSVKGVFHKNILITKNYLHNLDEAAIKAYNYVNLKITDNRIENAGLGVLAYTYIAESDNHYKEPLKTTVTEVLPKNYNITISDNSIKNIFKVKSGGTTKWGDGIRILGSAGRPIKSVELRNNTISNTKRYGIFVEEAPKCSVAQNTIHGTAITGIYLIEGCDTSTVNNNTVVKLGLIDKTAGGIGVLRSSKVTISYNTVKYPAKNGIFLYGNSTSCMITKNTIYKAGENGISINQQSNDGTIANNKINSYGKRGIFIYEVGSATINSNKVIAKVGNGSADAFQIIGDNSSKNVFTIKSNTINNSNRYGMYINNAPKSYIASNIIKDTKKHALYLDGSSNYSKIYYNKILNTLEYRNENNNIGVSKSKEVKIYKNIIE